MTAVTTWPADAQILPPRAVRWSVIAVATASILLPALSALTAPAGAALVTAGSVTSVFAVLGAFVLFRRPGHRIGWLYLAIGFETGAFQYVNTLGLRDDGSLSAYEFVLGWFAGAGWAIGPLLVVTFGLLWLPDGALPSPRWRWIERLAWLVLAGVVIVFPMTESPEPVRRLVGVDPAIAELLFLGVAGACFVAVLACVASPFVRYRGAGPRERHQLRLVGAGGLLAIAVYVAGDPIVRMLPLTWDHVFALAVAAVPIATTVAIVRHGLLDIGRVLRRTATYLLVTALLVGVYVSGVLGIGALLPSARDSDLLIALSTLAVAGLFHPVRTSMQGMVDRRFSRARYDAAQTVDAFGRELRDQVSLDSIVEALRSTAGTAVRPASVGIVVLQPVEEAR